MYTYQELIALLADLADPEHRAIATYSTQELIDLAYLLARVCEQIAAERSTRKD